MSNPMGRYLYHPEREPRHACWTPNDADAGDVWQCSCGRVYRWNNNRGYGFEWSRVVLRALFYRLRWLLTLTKEEEA